MSWNGFGAMSVRAADAKYSSDASPRHVMPGNAHEVAETRELVWRCECGLRDIGGFLLVEAQPVVGIQTRNGCVWEGTNINLIRVGKGDPGVAQRFARWRCRSSTPVHRPFAREHSLARFRAAVVAGAEPVVKGHAHLAVVALEVAVMQRVIV